MLAWSDMLAEWLDVVTGWKAKVALVLSVPCAALLTAITTGAQAAAREVLRALFAVDPVLLWGLGVILAVSTLFHHTGLLLKPGRTRLECLRRLWTRLVARYLLWFVIVVMAMTLSNMATLQAPTFSALAKWGAFMFAGCLEFIYTLTAWMGGEKPVIELFRKFWLFRRLLRGELTSEADATRAAEGLVASLDASGVAETEKAAGGDTAPTAPPKN